MCQLHREYRFLFRYRPQADGSGEETITVSQGVRCRENHAYHTPAVTAAQECRVVHHRDDVDTPLDVFDFSLDGVLVLPPSSPCLVLFDSIILIPAIEHVPYSTSSTTTEHELAFLRHFPEPARLVPTTSGYCELSA